MLDRSWPTHLPSLNPHTGQRGKDDVTLQAQGGIILARTWRPDDLTPWQIGEVVTTIPTIGFNVESVTYKNLNFNVWVGGLTSSGEPVGCSRD